MKNALKVGRYRHYKGSDYEVIGIAHRENTLEQLVVYKALYDSKDFGLNAFWVRPLKEFTENVEYEGKKIPRYTYVDKKIDR